MEQHQPRLCQEAEFMKVVRPGPADSPPPNCAICLGICTNKCFTDCCLHQFCFSCLLEWSKIKAECPLCKQPFKSIIYNIKSNLEYEEHIITNPEREVQGEDLLLDDDVHTEYLFLPNGPRPQRHFQYRTTFTLEPGGEFAIQQLLLAHPRTNSLYLPTDRYLHHRINQRRHVYTQGLWVEPQSDVSGRYRESSPSFFRDNPGQIHRIIPWLNRELSALLVDYVDIYQVQERILSLLPQYTIQSASFRRRIEPFLGNRTEHFLHEFYNFVRSPFDMIGYDRNITYSTQGPVIYSQSLSDDDSDVRVVDSPTNDDCIYVPPRTPEVIVIDSDSSSDSDEIIRCPSPPAIPPIVNLIDSDSNDNSRQVENERTETCRSPQLPIKIRYKINRNNTKNDNSYKRKERKNEKMKWDNSESDSDSYQPKSESEYSTAHISPSSSLSSSSESSSDSSSSYNNKYTKPLILKQVKSKSKKRKYIYKTSKHRSKKSSNADTPERSYRIKKKKSSKQKKSKRKNSDSSSHHRSKRLKKIKLERTYTSQFDKESRYSSSDDDDDYHRYRKSFYVVKKEDIRSEQPETKNEPLSEPTEFENNESHWKKNISDHENFDVAGPSHRHNLRSVVVKGNNKWYSRPDLEDDTSTDNNSSD